MGRIKKDGNGATFETNAGPPSPFGTMNSGANVMLFSGVGNSDTNSTPGGSSSQSEKKRRDIEFNQKRFIKSSSELSSLLKIGIPGGGFLFYGFYSWPKTYIPEGTYSLKRCLLSAAVKLVFWLAAFPSVLDLTKPDFDFKKAWDNHPWFAKRFCIWIFGLFPVIGALGSSWAIFLVCFQT